MKPIRLELKARNNRMISLREQLGLTVKQAAEKIGLNLGLMYRMEAPGFDPIRRHSRYDRIGCMRQCATKVCQFYGVEPDFLWPELMRRMTKMKVSREADFDEIEQLVSPVEMDQLPAEAPEDPIAHYDLEELVKKAHLRPRERLILRMVYLEDRGLNGTAEELGLSRERVRQIASKALAKCREHQPLDSSYYD